MWREGTVPGEGKEGNDVVGDGEGEDFVYSECGVVVLL